MTAIALAPSRSSKPYSRAMTAPRPSRSASRRARPASECSDNSQRRRASGAARGAPWQPRVVLEGMADEAATRPPEPGDDEQRVRRHAGRGRDQLARRGLPFLIVDAHERIGEPLHERAVPAGRSIPPPRRRISGIPSTAKTVNTVKVTPAGDEGYNTDYSGFIAAYRDDFRDVFHERMVQLPLERGDVVFFNPALFHGAGANDTADFQRMANLLQVSSAFGRTMETMNPDVTALAVYPFLDGLARTKQIIVDNSRLKSSG